MKGSLQFLLLLLCLATAWAHSPQNALTIAVSVVGPDNQPVPGIRIQVKAKDGGPGPAAAQTNAIGKVLITSLAAARYELAASKDGFETITREIDLSAGEPVALDLTLVPTLTRRDSVEVKDTISAVDQPAVASSVSPQIAKELPTRPATVADALPLIPGVVREPGGGLLISASAEHRSSLIVNSADVTDPGTGQFGLTVPIDSVESLNVYQTPYLAEYGRFTAGLVSVETRRGGDKWNWELNDPLPEFRIRSYHLRGLKTATPRLNFEGPLIARRLYLSEGFEYEIRKTPVYTLPFPHNQKREEGLNSFTQLDWVMSERNLVTGTAHIAPRRFGHANIDYFNPEPTSPNASTHNYTGTLADRLTLWGGLLEATFSTTQFDVAVWGEGPENLVIAPAGNRGNYFAQKNRTAGRYSGAATYTLPPVHFLGTHAFKLGGYAASTDEDGQAEGHPVDVLDASGRLLRHIAFSRPREFHIGDTETAFFWQDHWLLSPRFSIELGVRTEEQEISGAFRVAPRGGFAWSPFAHIGTVVRGGFGLFYDHVPLNIYAFNRYPDEIITWYGADGGVTEGPILFLNTLGQSKVRFPFVSQRPVDGNFSPHSENWSLQVEQPVTPALRLRLSYLQNDAAGLAILGTVPPDPAAGTGAYLLEGTGQSRYRQFEAMARVRAGERRELFFSYVYSRARGNLNDFGTFLGIFPVAIIRPDQVGNLNGSLPNRFLSWGILRLGKTWRAAPLFEVRNGFPYATTDAGQNYVGVPNRQRFPLFFSFDTRVSKDIQVNPKYAVRLSVSGFNLTNHFNPEAVHANTADPAFGYFFGHRGRRFTLDFDVLF